MVEYNEHKIEIVKIENYSEFSQEFLKEIKKIVSFKKWILERVYENIEDNSNYSSIAFILKINNISYRIDITKYFLTEKYFETDYLNYTLDISIFSYNIAKSVFITKYDKLILNELIEVLEYLKLQNEFIK